MKTPLAVHRSATIPLLMSLASLLAGCGTLFQADRPPVIIERDAVKADGKQWTKCKLPDCRGLRGATVLEIKSITVLRSKINPTCEVYYWDGYAWEYCWD